MQRIDFNEAWEFNDNRRTAIVNLPHDAMLFEERSRSNPAGGASAYFSGNRYSYKKKKNSADWQKGHTDMSISIQS